MLFSSTRIYDLKLLHITAYSDKVEMLMNKLICPKCFKDEKLQVFASITRPLPNQHASTGLPYSDLLSAHDWLDVHQLPDGTFKVEVNQSWDETTPMRCFSCGCGLTDSDVVPASKFGLSGSIDLTI